MGPIVFKWFIDMNILNTVVGDYKSIAIYIYLYIKMIDYDIISTEKMFS